MPGENFTFTTHVDPVSPPQPQPNDALQGWRKLVEAPGTAPGSATPIPKSVYRHSRRSDPNNISVPTLLAQGGHLPGSDGPPSAGDPPARASGGKAVGGQLEKIVARATLRNLW